MNRRELLSVGVGLAASAHFACTAAASPKAAVPIAKPSSNPDVRAALLAALQTCLMKAEACAAHCQTQLAAGHTEFAHCQAAVADSIAIGWALYGLVSRKSVSAKKLAEACVAACKECSTACAEHKAHFAHGMHVECRECMESCDVCVAACLAFIAA